MADGQLTEEAQYLIDLAPRLITRTEMCVVIDRDCPQCGHPEMCSPIAGFPDVTTKPIIGCRRCGLNFEKADDD